MREPLPFSMLTPCPQLRVILIEKCDSGSLKAKRCSLREGVLSFAGKNGTLNEPGKRRL